MKREKMIPFHRDMLAGECEEDSLSCFSAEPLSSAVVSDLVL